MAGIIRWWRRLFQPTDVALPLRIEVIDPHARYLLIFNMWACPESMIRTLDVRRLGLDPATTTRIVVRGDVNRAFRLVRIPQDAASAELAIPAQEV